MTVDATDTGLDEEAAGLAYTILAYGEPWADPHISRVAFVAAVVARARRSGIAPRAVIEQFLELAPTDAEWRNWWTPRLEEIAKERLFRALLPNDDDPEMN